MKQLCKIFLISLLLSACQPAAGASPQAKPEIGKAFISFRIGLPLSMPEARFQELLTLFEKYPGVTDEITFFTSFTHPPIPLDVLEQRLDILSKRMQACRQKGYRAGINILSTIGHHEENLDNSLQGDYQPMTDIDGKICRGSMCPNHNNLQQYVRSAYTAIAKANPDYIWLDDDIRLAGHMPIYLTCFCDTCIALFNKETGNHFTRQTLKTALDSGGLPEKLALRKAWLQHNRNTLANLFKLIENAVHGLRPGLPLGFMTGDRFFEGYDFDTWAGILSGPGRAPVYWRPGGGYYQDINTPELVGKSHDVGRQVSLLPPDVLSIQSEIENFPYQRLKKAANMVVLEACSHMAAGCTGAAFNVLSMYDEPLAEYEPLVKQLQQARPFFDLLAKHLGRRPISGVHTFWNKDIFATSNLSDTWFKGGTFMINHELYDIGLPTAYSGDHAQVVLLGKNNIYALSKEQIRNMLSGGVYMEAEALQQLNDMGFGDLTGFKVVRSDRVDRIEKFSDHPLNGVFRGRERDNRQSFWPEPGYTLEKTDTTSQTLAGLIDYSARQTAACTMGIFENRLGGRICVAGYYPWRFLQNLSKSAQMKSLLRWLSRDRLPGYIASFHKINLWVRQPLDGHVSLALTNSSFDPAENVVLALRTTHNRVTVFDMKGQATVISASETDGPYKKFVLPAIDPWQMRLVVD